MPSIELVPLKVWHGPPRSLYVEQIYSSDEEKVLLIDIVYFIRFNKGRKWD